ncbi:alpha/beta hydrolase [Pseudomonas sp. Teo4]|uniref:alpha/beta hydrolase n=1 Tax=Pseudomonas sp. Teo4 TaxID=3064528 RepID=UPI002AB8C311|nr:alpha/beta hydrolase [Pseudomonas sp. Teo4]MDZ3992547.1 Quorum-quenching protein AidA [Pseudomonas sp. Teo4]
MRTDIAFKTQDGLTLAGWLFSPGSSGRFPAIVMAHGFTAVKEQYLDKYGEAFADAGFAVLIYDNRNFGASEGFPRQEVDPVLQIRDYRDAITFAATLQQVDPSRIGVWGSSYSGGHVLQVAAFDRRVKCVVAQVPDISGSMDLRLAVRPDLLPGLFAAFEEDRAARYQGAEPVMLEVVNEDPKSDCALPGQDSYDFFVGSQKERAPAWRNEVTLRSVEMLNEYEPGSVIDRISPTPLLMLVAKHDALTVTDLALKAYEQALQPKRLELLEGGHFDPYLSGFDKSSQYAIEWFAKHL